MVQSARNPYESRIELAYTHTYISEVDDEIKWKHPQKRKNLYTVLDV